MFGAQPNSGPPARRLEAYERNQDADDQDDDAQEGRRGDRARHAGQGRATLERYRLQVDRQTKTSYPTHDAAETAGAAIKKAHPLVQVTIYDAKDSAITIL